MYITDTLRKYMKEINEWPLIEPAKERVLAYEIAQGSQEALEELAKANLRLVITIARDFENSQTPFEELVAEGNIGLMEAAARFDPYRGAKFSTYASWWVKQKMRKVSSDYRRLIHIPLSSVRKMAIVLKASRELEKELGYVPSDEEVSEVAVLGSMSANCVKGLRYSAGIRVSSLNALVFEEETLEIGDLIVDSSIEQPDEILLGTDLAKHVRRILPALSEREQTVLKLRFGLDGEPPQTLEKISILLNLTRERIRQIECRSLKKLRRILDDEKYADRLLHA